MQHTGGEGSGGGPDPRGENEARAGTTEPVTLVDLDGAETRIAPSGSWAHEQVRQPGGEPVYVTRLDRGQLWHRSPLATSTWTHRVEVGPATVASPRGRFHAVAEPDGGATVTCLEGTVEVSTGLRDALALEPDQAVAVAADGETCVVTEALEDDRPLLVEPASPPTANPRPATADHRWPGPGRPVLIALVLGTVLALTIVLIVLASRDPGGSSRSANRPAGRAKAVPRANTSTRHATSGVPSTAVPSSAAPSSARPRATTAPSNAPPVTAPASVHLDSCLQSSGGILAGGTVTNPGGGTTRYRVLMTLEDPGDRVLARVAADTAAVAPKAAARVDVLLTYRGPPAGVRCVVRSVTPS